MNDLPKKITPCPIKEAVFELRFESSVPEDAIFGIVFNQFKDEFNNTATPLPILEVPSQIRKQDPNLMFAPHYKMDSEFFTMQLGPKVISLVNIKEYKGWEYFQDTVGTSVTTAILCCGVNDQSLAWLPVKTTSSQAQLSYGLSFDRYTLVDNSYSQEKKNIETIHKFSSNLLENIEDIPLEFSAEIDENFWDLV